MLLPALGHRHPLNGYEAWLKYSHWQWIHHTPWEFSTIINYCFKNISVLPIPLASVQFPFIACYHYDGCAVPRSNNELGKAFPLLPKLICHEMCLAGPWVGSAFCLAAALAAAPCRTVRQDTAPAASSNCCLLLLNSGTFNSAVWVNTESTCFPVSWKVATFFTLVFPLKLIELFSAYS